MTVLAAPINETTRTIRVDAAIANPTYPLFRTLDAETIKVTGGATTVSWQIERGIGDTTPAAHIAGTALAVDTAPFGASEGGGGVTVDNTVDAPFAASTLIAAGAVESGVGEATLADAEVVLQEVTRLLTAAEVNDLFSTPIALLPAVPGTMYWPIRAIAIGRFVTTSPPEAGLGGAIQIDHDGVGSVMFTVSDSLVLGDIFDTIVFMNAIDGASLPLDDVTGAALVVHNTLGDYTDGDCTLEIRVVYRAVEVA